MLTSRGQMSVHVHMCVRACAHCVCVCIHVCVHACVCECTCALTCIHTHSHTKPKQVVTGTSLGEVAKEVILGVRFPLLDPDKLGQVEQDNQTKQYIPVSA